MLYLQDFMAEWGYLVFFALGFAEFIGVPIASVPVLVLGSAVAATTTLFMPVVPLAVTAGAVLADALMYWAGRSRGKWTVDAACGLSSNPLACVLKVQKTLQKIGPRYILGAKFTPGIANLIAPAAGLAQLPPGRFFPLATTALLLWSTLVTGLGWALSGQLQPLILFILRNSEPVGLALVAMVLVAGLWRIQKVRRHKGTHVRMGHAR